MNKQYWKNFYQKEGLNNELVNPSTFAIFCQKEFLQKPKTIIELGCGNGRDSLYFANQSHSVLAIDQYIDQEVRDIRHHKNLQYIENDFIQYSPTPSLPVNVAYSRFTIHSITQQEQDKLLPIIYKYLPPKGLLCIEARTTKDPKYGVGECVEENTYTNNNHERRFIDTNVFTKTVLDLGFKLRYFNEQNNLSIYKDDNPVLMRVILEK